MAVYGRRIATAGVHEWLFEVTGDCTCRVGIAEADAQVTEKPFWNRPEFR